MKKLLIMLLAVLTTAGLQAAEANYNVVPQPDQVLLLKGQPFIVSETTPVCYPQGNFDMERNARFLTAYIKDATGMRLATATYEGKKLPRRGIVLTLDNSIAGPEAYRISVSQTVATISGSTPAGVFYGVQTLRKALPLEQGTVSLPAATVSAQPRFAYRGLLIDVSRHFFDADAVKNFIDIMALHGLNRFHWHLTEDQGWRVEIKKYPRLTEVGAWRSGTVLGHNSAVDDGVRHGGFYTQEQIRDIVQYAADRYITVIPEIDLPGHMLAALASYPELGCTGGPYEVEHHWGVFDDILCAGKESTFTFLENVLDEFVSLFPSEYIHIGGDESPRTRWKECPACQQRIADLGLKPVGKRSAEDLLQGYVTTRVQQYLTKKGKRIIGWDELLECHVDTTATIMSWRGALPGAEAAKLGHDVIMSPYTPLYINQYQTKYKWAEPESFGDGTTVLDVYRFNPIDPELTPDERRHIIGVQANLWSEYIAYPSLVQYQLLPRLAAVAEVQWVQPENKSFARFKESVTRLREHYQQLGWIYAKHLWIDNDENKE